MTVTEAAPIIIAEIREAGNGFTIEGYEQARERLASLTGITGLALKTIAGRISREAV